MSEMNLLEAADLVSEVQGQINKMLIDLEKQIGRKIRRAELQSIDITTIHDERRRIDRSFQIVFAPSQSEGWLAEDR